MLLSRPRTAPKPGHLHDGSSRTFIPCVCPTSFGTLSKTAPSNIRQCRRSTSARSNAFSTPHPSCTPLQPSRPTHPLPRSHRQARHSPRHFRPPLPPRRRVLRRGRPRDFAILHSSIPRLHPPAPHHRNLLGSTGLPHVPCRSRWGLPRRPGVW